ncbi:MAG TPA: hypothetical protein VFJ85_16020 [Acidimicrobiales bacterium]|nr:hypothetical protein [Acidimicrobiales bacterium]
MLAAGRITEDEGAAVRAAAGTGDLDAVLAGIRRRHALERVGEEVRRGRLSQAEAVGVAAAIERGEDPGPALRRRRRHGA